MPASAATAESSAHLNRIITRFSVGDDVTIDVELLDETGTFVDPDLVEGQAFGVMNPKTGQKIAGQATLMGGNAPVVRCVLPKSTTINLQPRINYRWLCRVLTSIGTVGAGGGILVLGENPV